MTGATKLLIETEDHAAEVLRRATRARSTDATAMNALSSRSHAVFTLHITGALHACHSLQPQACACRVIACCGRASATRQGRL